MAVTGSTRNRLGGASRHVGSNPTPSATIIDSGGSGDSNRSRRRRAGGIARARRARQAGPRPEGRWRGPPKPHRSNPTPSARIFDPIHRVPAGGQARRNGRRQTPSGPEGSSGSRTPPCAGDSPGRRRAPGGARRDRGRQAMRGVRRSGLWSAYTAWPTAALSRFTTTRVRCS